MMKDDETVNGQPRRMRWADSARGLGILLVVYGHVARGMHGAGLFPDERTFTVIDSVIYTFHIPLFFFLSGIFCPDSLNRRGRRDFLTDKIRVLFYPYAVWSLLQGTAEVLFSAYTNGQVTFAEVLSFPWAPRAHLWFLYVLLLMFILAALTGCQPSPGRFLSFLILSAGLYVFRNSLPAAIPVRYLAGNLVFFVAGACWGQAAGTVEKRTAVLFPLFITGAVLSQVVFHGYLNLTFRTGMSWLTLPVSLASVLGTVACCRLMERLRLPWLTFLGRASLTIYLMHILAAAGVRILLDRGMDVRDPFVHLAAGVAAGVLLPLLIRDAIRRLHLRFLYRPAGIAVNE